MSEVNRYFYVMWPEDREASSTSSHSPRASPSVTVAVENGSENIVKVHGNGPITTPLRLAYAPPAATAVVQQQHQQQDSEDEESETPSPAGLLIVRPTGDRHELTRVSPLRSCKPQVVEKPATVAVASNYCTRCLMKDSEIARLWKKVEALEEQLCRALKSKRPKNIPSLENVVVVSNSYKHAHSSTSPATSDSSEDHSLNNCAETSNHETVPEPTPKMVLSGAQKQDDKIELVPGTSLFISATRLQQILSTVKTGKQLARKLMSVFWDRSTLARSTLSASSQNYEQLDPQIVSAIKTYCMLFDSSVRKSEIHSTMIDKCVQSRRPRRSSLKRMDYHEVKISPTLLVPVSEAPKAGTGFACISAPIQDNIMVIKPSNETEDKMSD